MEFWTRIVPPAATIADVSFLESAARSKPGARVLDIPCGNGRHAIELARRGYQVTGVDISSEFLEAALRGAASAEVRIDWRTGDMRRVDCSALTVEGPFDAAICFGNSFGYLDRDGAEAFLEAMAACLKPDGVFVVETGCAAESLLPSLTRNRWIRAGDIVMLSDARYSAGDSRLDVDYTFVHDGRMETRAATSYVFTVAELKHLFRRAGFEVRSLEGGVNGEPYSVGSPRLILTAVRT